MGACGDGILLEKETLREGAQRWLREKKKRHSTLTATTFEGVG